MIAALTVSSALALDCMRDSLSASLKSATSLALGFLDSASAIVGSLRVLSLCRQPLGPVPVVNLNQSAVNARLVFGPPSARMVLCQRLLTCS